MFGCMLASIRCSSGLAQPDRRAAQDADSLYAEHSVVRLVPGVQVKVQGVAGKVIGRPGRPVDPVRVAVLVDAAGVVAAGPQFAQDRRFAGAGQARDVEESHRLRVPASAGASGTAPSRPHGSWCSADRRKSPALPGSEPRSCRSGLIRHGLIA